MQPFTLVPTPRPVNETSSYIDYLKLHGFLNKTRMGDSFMPVGGVSS